MTEITTRFVVQPSKRKEEFMVVDTKRVVAVAFCKTEAEAQAEADKRNPITRKITGRLWDDLRSGKTKEVHGRAGSRLFVGSNGDDVLFIMERGTERHTLLAMCTDEVRLDAHWQGFNAKQG